MTTYWGDPNLAALASAERVAALRSGAAVQAANANAGADRFGSAMGAAGNFANAFGTVGASFATPYATLAPGIANTFGSYADGLGQIGQAMGAERSNLYNAYAAQMGQLAPAAANAYGQYAAGISGLAPSMSAAYGQYTTGLGNLAAARASQRTGANTALAQGMTGIAGARASALAGNANAYQYGLGSLANAQSSALNSKALGLSGIAQAQGQERSGLFNSFANALGNLATAQSNEAISRQSGAAQAEAARQIAMGNIGSASLGAFGSASNAALNAWAMQQSEYNRALANLGVANQQGLSNIGMSRNSALGGLGSAGATLAGQGAVASVVPKTQMSLGGGFGGTSGSFNASGAGGPIASGGFAGGGLSAGGAGGSKEYDASQIAGLSAPGYGQLDSSRGAVMSRDLSGDMTANLGDASNRLERASMARRPQEILADTLSGLLRLGNQSIGGAAQGMNQYYGNMVPDKTNFAPMLANLSSLYEGAARRAKYDDAYGRLGDGFSATGRGLDRTRAAMGSGFRSTLGAANDDSRYLTALSQGVTAGDDYADYAQRMGDGFGGTMGNIGALRGDLSSGLTGTQGVLSNLASNFRSNYDNAIGNVNYSQVLDPMTKGFDKSLNQLGQLPGVFNTGMNQAFGPISGVWGDTRDMIWGRNPYVRPVSRNPVRSQPKTNFPGRQTPWPRR